MKLRGKWVVGGTVVVLTLLVVGVLIGYFFPHPDTPEYKLSKLLANVREGMTEQEVLKLLGNPDEVRQVPTDDVLDGTRVYSTLDDENPEVYRWAYGVKQKGTFARTGIVSFDKTRRVVCARSPVHRRFGADKIHLPSSDEAVPTPSGLSCHLGEVSFTEARGYTVRHYAAEVTLMNAGQSEYSLKYDTVSIRSLLVVEIYDSNRQLIFQEDNLRYHSPAFFDRSKWPVLRISPGQSKSDQIFVSPGSYFGALPPGKYFLRVCFPFEKWNYSPSNLAPFEVPLLRKALSDENEDVRYAAAEALKKIQDAPATRAAATTQPGTKQ